ncbi:MAG: malate dehydrogenase [Sulfuricella sp.]|nr:malate dehydrogenase [Sulfuricella sp.]
MASGNHKAKLSIIGAGNVGSHVAVYAAGKDLADIVLLDQNADKARGTGLDITQAMAMANIDRVVTGTGDYAATAGSDVVVITAGLARKPGMSRDDLLEANAGIVQAVTREAVRHSPGCILVVVTNPVNTMAQLAYEVSGLPRERVIGVSGVLDSARFKAFIAEELSVGASRVDAVVLGDHGAQMVPLVDHCQVNGVPIGNLMSPERIAAIVERVRHGGSEIVNLLKTGSAYYAPGTATVELLECILKDRQVTIPCAVYLEGEYGVDGLYVGVPALIGAAGVEKVIQLNLSATEQRDFDLSVVHIRERLDTLRANTRA